MKHLGDNIKSLRRKKRLTLLDVSKRTGIDSATLSRIENSKMIGTIQSHMSIAKALEVRLPDLYEKALETENASDIQPREQVAALLADGSNLVTELLTPQGAQRKMTVLREKLKNGSKTVTETYSLGTERFIYCLSGKIELVLKEQVYTLNEGDSLYFSASAPHYFMNNTKTLSTYLSVMSPVYS